MTSGLVLVAFGCGWFPICACCFTCAFGVCWLVVLCLFFCDLFWWVCVFVVNTNFVALI